MAARSRFHLVPSRLPLALASALLVLLLTSVARAAPIAPVAPVAVQAQGIPPTSLARSPLAQTSYLALGDSLAFGYSQAKFNSLYPTENPASYDTGYVDDFGRVLRLLGPGRTIVNDGCPGETTDSFIKGPCAYQLAFALHHPYAGGPSSSQLSDALNYLSAHPGAVDPITLDIGANDALGLIEGTCKLEPACIANGAPAVFAHVATNLGQILGQLRAAAPHAQIIVLGLYNPFGTTIAGANELTAALNSAMAGVAATVGARFADPLPIFNPHGVLEAPTICLLTNMCTPLVDIHPTDLGYATLAGLILRQYVLGLPPLQRRPWLGLRTGATGL